VTRRVNVRLVGVSATLALTLGLTACGGDTLSTRELRNKATTLCTLANKQTNQLAPPSAPAGAAAFITDGAAILRPQLARLRALHAPSDLAQVYNTAIDGFARKLDVLDAAARDLKAGEDPVIAMKTLQTKLTPLEQQEDGAWQALEIPACVNR
jgi:hypothetical protein